MGSRIVCRFSVLVLLSLYAAAPLYAAASTPAAPAAITTVPSTTVPPTVDGVIDEWAWRHAAFLSDFELRPGLWPQEPTDARFLTDRATLYVAFTCRDSDPSQIVARQRRADGSFAADDHVIVEFGSPGRPTARLAVNPRGTVHEQGLAGPPRFSDVESWKARARRTDFGWTAEMAIPLGALEPIDGGIEVRLLRYQPRTGETSEWGGLVRSVREVTSGRLAVASARSLVIERRGTVSRETAVVGDRALLSPSTGWVEEPTPTRSASPTDQTWNLPAARPVAQRTNDPAAPRVPYRAPTAAPISGDAVPRSARVGGAPTDYVIGSGDVLAITVFDQPELSGKYTPALSGELSFPLVGLVQAGGRTVQGFEQDLKDRLAAGFIRNPQLMVSIETYRSQQVFVVGEVRLPGPVQLTGRMTLIEALARAGSTNPEASREVVIVRPPNGSEAAPALPGEHSGAQVMRVSLNDLESGLLGGNVDLRANDTIFVPRVADVYVFGQVRNPGAYPIKPGMTVLQALSLAGGVSEFGASNRIKIIRLVDGQEREFKAKLRDQVQAGDTITVPERFF